MTLKISSPADVARPAPKPFELPQEQNGKRLVFLIRALNMADIAQANGQPPVMSPDGPRDLGHIDVEEAANKSREIARLGIVEPKLNFDTDQTSPHWNDLSAGNQMAIVEAISRASGVNQSPDGEAAKRAAGFPVEPPGTGHGADAHPALFHAKATA